MQAFVKGVAITLGALTGAVVLVHLPPVQRAMGWRNAQGEVICPVGFNKERASLRTTIARSVRTAQPSTLPVAGARPALGFALDVTTRADVIAWASRHGVLCSELRHRATLECPAVPAPALGGSGLDATTAWFELTPNGTLIGVKTSRRTDTVAPVAATFRATAAALSATTGAPTVALGDASDAGLSRGTFQQASVEYRYRGYRAVVRATNMGDGFVLTESYASTIL